MIDRYHARAEIAQQIGAWAQTLAMKTLARGHHDYFGRLMRELEELEEEYFRDYPEYGLAALFG